MGTDSFDLACIKFIVTEKFDNAVIIQHDQGQL